MIFFFFLCLIFFLTLRSSDSSQVENDESISHHLLIRCDQCFGTNDEKACQPHELPSVFTVVLAGYDKITVTGSTANTSITLWNNQNLNCIQNSKCFSFYHFCLLDY